MGIIMRRRGPFRGFVRSAAFCGLVVSLVAGLSRQASWRHNSYGVVYHSNSRRHVGGRVHNNTLYRPGYDDTVFEQFDYDDPCRNFPDTKGIQLVMKTGATEIYDKLPAHLLTALQCLPDVLLFSDREEQIGQWYVHNALDEVSDSIKAKDPESFGLYKEQIECPVLQKSCADAAEKGGVAWNLDKYKFLPMVVKTWRMRPNMQWYVFADADSYVFWRNMVTWIRKLNPKDRLYLGSLNLVEDFPFAHGGSGYIISGVLLKELVENNPNLDNEYNERASGECCGDVLLAEAISEKTQVTLTDVWPMLNGETQATMPFGQENWCQPIMTLHHMDSQQVASAWQFEQTRKKNDVIQIKDLYHAFMAPHLTDHLEDWDNMSEDVCFLNHDPEAQKSADRFFLDRQKPLNEQSEVERNAWQSWQDCAAVCDADPAGHDLDSHHPHIGAKGDEDEEIRNPRLAMSSWVSAATQARLELRRAKRAVGAKEEQMQASGHRHGHGGHGGHRINKTGKAPHSSGYLDDAAIVERRKSRQCFQWRYHDGVCCVGKSFRQGKPRRPSWEDREKLGEDRARWHSGWHVSGIRDWVDAMGECEAQWVKVR